MKTKTEACCKHKLGATTIGRNGGPLSSNVEEWYWEGSIAEIRSYNSALSDSERQAVENELQQKWFGSSGEACIYYNPYESVNWDTVKQYKANFHTHTTESDGRMSPSEVINSYSNAGYRILVITDHDSFGGADTTWPWSKWIDEKPAHINSNSGMETSVFYSNLGPGGMLAVRGNEISSTDHIGSFSAITAVPPQAGRICPAADTGQKRTGNDLPSRTI